jgi:predicted GNAT superfamily acetyltransferase
MTFAITPVHTIEECRLIEQLQIDIWRSTDLEAVPDHMLITLAKEGGIVLLARTQSGQAVGFGYGFLSQTKTGALKLASHQVGVLPAHQDSGLGYQIKLAQRNAALARGLTLITWTFDPLQGRNARFNMHKLGAVSCTYQRNVYGKMRDELNQGLPTDRFRADWWLNSAHVTARLAGPPPESRPPTCPVLNPAAGSVDLPQPPASFDPPHGPCCLVEIPADIQQLKIAAPDLAQAWRLHTRAIFETAFAAGYTAVDLLRRNGRNYYLLQQNFVNGECASERVSE